MRRKKSLKTVTGTSFIKINHFGTKLESKKQLPKEIHAFIDLRGEPFSPPTDIMFTIKRGETLEIMVDKKSATKMAKAFHNWAQQSGNKFHGRQDNCKVSRIFITKTSTQTTPWWFANVELAKDISINCVSHLKMCDMSFDVPNLEKMPKGTFFGLTVAPSIAKKATLNVSKWAKSKDVTLMGVTSQMHHKMIILKK